MPTKNPSNSDILKELKTMNQRIDVLEQWKVSEDAYRAALKQIKRDDEESKYTNLRDKELTSRTDIWKQVMIVLGLIIAGLYAYLATKGIHP